MIDKGADEIDPLSFYRPPGRFARGGTEMPSPQADHHFVWARWNDAFSGHSRAGCSTFGGRAPSQVNYGERPYSEFQSTRRSQATETGSAVSSCDASDAPEQLLDGQDLAIEGCACPLWTKLIEQLIDSNAQALIAHQHRQKIKRKRGKRFTRSEAVPLDERVHAFERKSARVDFVERLNEKTVLLRWHDATAGLFGEQPWTLYRARYHGICGLSGSRIYRGDFVYRPSTRARSMPSNADETILESSIVSLEGSTSCGLGATDHLLL
ncbi:DUF3331 domain-containing protein [Paraburkholderia caledonica]|uniref:DUF3331 domain-containing protein n=1 Tax=Paraburkholderia caledonica TaxID=134536 RepID=A0ABU1KZ10_9BURK|nr:DUF3331 domain-containing protein [Paraburkholderia caledonica]MDR6376196.1 hypothetical protein [Paraburkholderia caledonica]